MSCAIPERPVNVQVMLSGATLGDAPMIEKERVGDSPSVVMMEASTGVIMGGTERAGGRREGGRREEEC